MNEFAKSLNRLKGSLPAKKAELAHRFLAGDTLSASERTSAFTHITAEVCQAFLTQSDDELTAQPVNQDSDLREVLNRVSAVHRTRVSTGLQLLSPVGEIPAARMPLQWAAPQEISSFRVDILGTEGQVVWTTNTRERELPYPDELPDPAIGKPFTWRVTVNMYGTEVSRTATATPVDLEAMAAPSARKQPSVLKMLQMPRTRWWLAATAVILLALGIRAYRPGHSPTPIRGGNIERSALLGLSPQGAIRTTRPTFTWKESGTATITLVDGSLQQVHEWTATGTSSEYPADAPALQSGQQYGWVIRIDGGPESSIILFEVE